MEILGVFSIISLFTGFFSEELYATIADAAASKTDLKLRGVGILRNEERT